MKLDDAISAIEACGYQAELNQTLQNIAEGFGFASYSFLDIGAPHLDEPFWTSTTGQDWEETYRSNQFIHVDAMIQSARRTNRPFRWGDVRLPEGGKRRKPGSVRVMHASRDYGFLEGLVIPLHFVDDRGVMCSSLCTLFWKDACQQFSRTVDEYSHRLHLILIYWIQRSLEVRKIRPEDTSNITFFNRYGAQQNTQPLTDREREVVAWAARGKTVSETAEILALSNETVQTHIKNAIEKLRAGNKTHAVAKAINLGMVDI